MFFSPSNKKSSHTLEDHVLFNFLENQRRSKSITHRPNLTVLVQKLSGQSRSINRNQLLESPTFARSKHDDDILDMCKKLLYCHELLDLRPKILTKRTRQFKSIELTPEEKVLFDEEPLLSSRQEIIAHASGIHKNRQQMKSSNNRLSNDNQIHLPIHTFCRKGTYPGSSIHRQEITDEQVPWNIELPNYKPPYYTHPSILNFTLTSSDTYPGQTLFIDPEMIPSDIMWNQFDTNKNIDRRTASPTGQYPIDEHGYPLNPLGRTGLRGRGQLARWAVNYKTHLIIMCSTNTKQNGKDLFKYLMKKSSKDNNSHWRIPSTWTTGIRMLAVMETLQSFILSIYLTWNGLKQVENEIQQNQLNRLIEHLIFVSTAYIDDAKNTDNAWLETTVCCYVQNNTIEHIDLNELFPDSSPFHHQTKFTWHQLTRTSHLFDSERHLLRLIAKRYNAFW